MAIMTDLLVLQLRFQAHSITIFSPWSKLYWLATGTWWPGKLFTTWLWALGQ